MAERAVEVWPAVVKVIAHYQTLAPSYRPRNNKSYDILVKYHNDKFVLAKLQFFKDIATIFEGFLKVLFILNCQESTF